MLEIESSRAEKDARHVTLAGRITESMDFETLLGPVPARLYVDCKGIEWINSIGALAWMQYFQMLFEKGVRVCFRQCAPAIVEQINLLSNFTCNGEVESIYLPFLCLECQAESSALALTEDLRRLGTQLPSHTCPCCGGTNTVFDEVQELYFAFLTRPSGTRE